MKKLEDFVKKQRDDFDSKLPSSDLWEKIESKLEEKEKKTYRLWKFSAAVAAVLLLAFISTLILKSPINKGTNYANISDPELVDLLQTEAYYAQKVSGQMNEINKCYKIYPELKEDLESDLNELDAMYQELKKDLNDNIYNREVIEAMIQNKRLKSKMVNRVLQQINC
jgi:hypothetical protein